MYIIDLTIVIFTDNLNKGVKAVSDKMATIASYAGGAVAVAGGLGLNEILAIAGFVVAVATFAYNVWYKERMLKELKNKNQITITGND